MVGEDVDNEKEGYLLPNLSLENNLLTFRLNVPVAIRPKVTTGAFSQNIGKLLSKLKLICKR